jgi:predicted small lipoprotein YifL
MRAILTALLVGLSALTLTGCGDKKAQKTPMELKDVPPDIMKVAKEKLPGVTFDAAWKESNGNFEVRGKTKSGKVREIDVAPDGTVTEID